MSTIALAVHVGAGYHSPSYVPKYRAASHLACNSGRIVLEQKGTAVDAVVASIASLEVGISDILPLQNFQITTPIFWRMIFVEQ
jgi:isoaspartyl peptidase/L-asparaginase-like protein (Ntn-hydrolase superfamily)